MHFEHWHVWKSSHNIFVWFSELPKPFRIFKRVIKHAYKMILWFVLKWMVYKKNFFSDVHSASSAVENENKHWIRSTLDRMGIQVYIDHSTKSIVLPHEWSVHLTVQSSFHCTRLKDCLFVNCSKLWLMRIRMWSRI